MAKKVVILKGKKPKANDSYEGFEDEFTLAELIQNAAARGLASYRGALFAKPGTFEEFDYDTGEYRDEETLVEINLNCGEETIVQKKGAIRKNPPKGATCACALGAMALTPKLTHPLTILAMQGNDHADGDELQSTIDPTEKTYYADLRSLQIGLAYEQALRPE